MQIHLKTLGCRLNEAELESWAKGFQDKGHTISTSENNADILVVNTCAVTQEAVKKSRQLIRKSQRNNPTAKLVVSGCYASLDKELQNDISGVDLVVNNQNKDELVDITLNALDTTSMPTISTEPGESSLFKRGRNRAFIKIQDGCRYRCTFCIVTVARGSERSRTHKMIIDDINRFYQEGVREVVLTGVHVGGFGSDIDSSLYDLIQSTLNETDMPRIRLASVEPWDLPDNFFNLFSNKRLMPHLHLPLQSGDDQTLKRMARRCKTVDYKNLIENARLEIENFNLTTDIIVGFPGESESEWKNTLSFIEEIGFSHIHIFSYSKREGTKAASLMDQVDPITKKQRSRALHDLAKRMRFQFLQSQMNKTMNVLWESKNRQNKWTGYTDNFIKVELQEDNTQSLENSISKIKLLSIDDDSEHCLVNLHS